MAVSSFPAGFGKPKPGKRPFSRCFCLKMGGGAEDFAILMLNMLKMLNKLPGCGGAPRRHFGI
jgi:hypothetical protein